ncbi:MAG: hypothetical protein LQ349_007061 [Xanthoria aureola]|nr:MAG: hypothetical protein LQ349_007061 [Xanthoria aureola]
MANGGAVNQQQQANIWAQMAYIPPRGSCSQKLSLLTTCPCFRFMIHPLKASTSFECDGCGHHASFHKMDNHQDDETVRRWKTDEEDRILGRETLMNYSNQQAVKAGLPPVHAGARQPQRRQIETRGQDTEDDDLQILDETETELEARPVRKRKRASGR